MAETVSFPAERTAVVTGAASPRGIGRATADRLARDGWSVGIVDVDPDAAASTAAEIAAARGVQVIGVGADVSARTAAPVVGGLWSCMLLTLLVLPAAYAMWRRHQVRVGMTASLPHDVATASAGAV